MTDASDGASSDTKAICLALGRIEGRFDGVEGQISLIQSTTELIRSHQESAGLRQVALEGRMLGLEQDLHAIGAECISRHKKISETFNKMSARTERVENTGRIQVIRESTTRRNLKLAGIALVMAASAVTTLWSTFECGKSWKLLVPVQAGAADRITATAPKNPTVDAQYGPQPAAGPAVEPHIVVIQPPPSPAPALPRAAAKTAATARHQRSTPAPHR